MDGPFAETKELIAGFWLWQVNSFEDAVGSRLISFYARIVLTLLPSLVRGIGKEVVVSSIARNGWCRIESQHADLSATAYQQVGYDPRGQQDESRQLDGEAVVDKQGMEYQASAGPRQDAWPGRSVVADAGDHA